MRALVGNYAFVPAQTSYPDGIRSNFEFQGDAIAKPVWRYMDLTAHVVYLADLLARTIREDMREQSQYLHRHGQARAAMKDIVEMPDMQADRIIRSVEENKGKLSNALAKEIPLLAEPGLWEAIVEAITLVFDQGPRGHDPDQHMTN